MLLSFLTFWVFLVFVQTSNAGLYLRGYCSHTDRTTPEPTRTPTHNCGITFASDIVGSSDAASREFPWMVALMRPQTGSEIEEFYCGGSIISERFILTAAHCVTSSVVPRIREITAWVGTINLNRELSQQYYEISIYFRHPDYDAAPSLHNDIAILKTKSLIRWSERVRPICLPFRDVHESFEDNCAIVAGWETLETSEENSNITLKKVTTMVQPNHVCNKNNFTNSELCTYNPHKDSCASDSGDPIISTGNRKFLIGIVSGGGVCGKSPGVNVRVTHYLDWIEDTVNALMDSGAYFEKHKMRSGRKCNATSQLTKI